MMRVITNRKALALLGACTALGAGGAGAAGVAAAATKKPTQQPKPVTRTVKVSDDFFLPTKVTITEGSSVKWVWGPDIDVHNVTLVGAPKHVIKARFKSVTGSTALVFKRRFTVPGVYHFICTIHPGMMHMTVTVKK
jgi:plastocyanin